VLDHRRQEEPTSIVRSDGWVFISFRQQGLSIRKIATLRHMSRNAVRRALRSTAPPTGKRRRAKGVKLEPYKGLIDTWMRDEVKSQWTAGRIFDELQDRGYGGGRTVVKDYVHEHRPRPPAMAEARFYVKPGQQVRRTFLRHASGFEGDSEVKCTGKHPSARLISVHLV